MFLIITYIIFHNPREIKQLTLLFVQFNVEEGE